MITAGIDIGSTYAKVALLHSDGRILGTTMIPTGFRLTQAAEEVFKVALRHVGLTPADVAYTVSTGAGRYQVEYREGLDTGSWQRLCEPVTAAGEVSEVLDAPAGEVSARFYRVIQPAP